MDRTGLRTCPVAWGMNPIAQPNRFLIPCGSKSGCISRSAWSDSESAPFTDELAGVRPNTALSKVLLPAPEGPTRPTTSPCLTFTETFESICVPSEAVTLKLSTDSRHPAESEDFPEALKIEFLLPVIFGILSTIGIT